MTSLFPVRATILLGILSLSAGCACDTRPPQAEDGGGTGGGGGSATPDGGEGDAGGGLVSLEVAPSGRGIAVGTALQLTATGLFSDGSRRDVTAASSWGSSAPAVATVSTAGRVSGLAAGTAIISAALDGRTASMTVQVSSATLASISVTPTTATIARGTTQQFVATGVFSDATSQELTDQVTWSSSAPATATVSPVGLASGVAPGSATLSAALLGVSGSATLSVTAATLTSLAVTPVAGDIAVGTQQQFTAVGTFSDNSTQELTAVVSWSSSSLTVATLSMATGEEGLVTGVGAGAATITASRDGLSARATLTVNAATLTSITVTPAAVSLPVGATQALVATGRFSDGSTQDLTTQVGWSSSDVAVTTVSNAAGDEGVARAVGAGSATLTATLTGVSGTAQVTVTNVTLSSLAITPTNASITLGATQQYTATGTFSDGSTRVLTAQANWASSNPNAATISNAVGSEGLATAQGLGGTTISATLMGRTGSTALTVSVTGGATLQSIALTPTNATMAAGTTRQYTATGTYSDGSTRDLTAQASWSSSSTATATVSNTFNSRGLVSALAVGATTLSATLQGVTGSTALTVSAATLTSITVTPSNPSLPRTFQLQLRATGTYSDNSTQDLTANVTWGSGTTSVATISNAAATRGVATGAATGTSSITATLGSTSGSTLLTVTNATLLSIAVSPSAVTLSNGQTRQLTATATFSDNSQLDVTRDVTWSSSSFQAQVSTTGLVSVFSFMGGGGTATITAARNGVSGASTVTITP